VRPSPQWFRHTLSKMTREASTREIQKSITGHTTDRMAEHYDRIDIGEKQAALRKVLPLVIPLNARAADERDKGQ
jgi:hypothetical protein